MELECFFHQQPLTWSNVPYETESCQSSSVANESLPHSFHWQFCWLTPINTLSISVSLQPPKQQLHQENCDVSPFSHLHALPNRNVEKKAPQSQWSPEFFSVKFGDGKSHQEWYPRSPCSIQSKVSCNGPYQLSPRSPWFGGKKTLSMIPHMTGKLFFFVVFCFVWASFRYIVRLLPEIPGDSHWFIWSLSIPIVCHSEVLFLQRHGSGAPTGNGRSHGGSNATVHLLGVNIFTQSSWLFFIHAPVISYFLTKNENCFLTSGISSRTDLRHQNLQKKIEALNLIGLCWMISPHAGSLNFNGSWHTTCSIQVLRFS